MLSWNKALFWFKFGMKSEIIRRILLVLLILTLVVPVRECSFDAASSDVQAVFDIMMSRKRPEACSEGGIQP
jgi:hypothetical protein